MKKKLRRLKLESGIWRYLVTGGWDRAWYCSYFAVTVWTPGGRKIYLERDAAGVPIWGGHAQQAVTPGSLRRYIEKHLL